MTKPATRIGWSNDPLDYRPPRNARELAFQLRAFEGGTAVACGKCRELNFDRKECADCGKQLTKEDSRVELTPQPRVVAWLRELNVEAPSPESLDRLHAALARPGGA